MKYEARFVNRNTLIIYICDAEAIIDLDKMCRRKLKRFINNILPLIDMPMTDFSMLTTYLLDRRIILERK